MSSVSGCMASSMRRPSTYGHSSTREPTYGIVLGIGERHELDELGVAHRLDRLISSPSEAHPGDHHRPALDAAQAVDALFLREPAFSRSSIIEPGGFFTSPSTSTVQGVVLSVWAFCAGSDLSVPNS